MKFPYGISDFYQIITEDYLYLDRTDRIRFIEDNGKQLLFLRPRRFGKSLWLSTLANYYDLAKADQFERLFGHLAIGKNPTPLHNQYLILRWDFSLIVSSNDEQEVKRALYNHINNRISQFSNDYQHVLGKAITIDKDDALISFDNLLYATKLSPHHLYLFIDEYDNFANEVLTASRERYESLLQGEGLLKTIFKAIKAATGMGLDRAFITGVSPVVMSDVTSGYNVAENIYFAPELNDLCGFSENEVEDIVGQVARHCGYKQQQADEAMLMMRRFYNGYRFSKDTETLVYNPTLAFYFLKYWYRYCKYPHNMLDDNLAMDRNKIAYIANLPGGEAVIASALDEENLPLVNHLANRFGVADMMTGSKDSVFMASLLYFFGVLTLGGQTPLRQLILCIPNLVVRQLYIEQIRESLLPGGRTQDAIRQIAEQFYTSGNMQPLCDFIESKLFRVLDNRDYRWMNEFGVKMAFLSLLFNDFFYIADSEPELGRGYADMTLIARPDMRDTPLLDFLMEFKYVSLKTVDLSGEAVRQADVKALHTLSDVAQALDDAQTQLKTYRQQLSDIYGDKLKLRSYAVVVIGFERLIWIEP